MLCLHLCGMDGVKDVLQHHLKWSFGNDFDLLVGLDVPFLLASKGHLGEYVSVCGAGRGGG